MNKNILILIMAVVILVLWLRLLELYQASTALLNSDNGFSTYLGGKQSKQFTHCLDLRYFLKKGSL